ncbi:MAG: hypothetical protein AVDCRST_MAG93-2555 [uncultured Chloroflexia bacterium]|uniref:Uncharacterized protein n=1 Tax=uncultured Chloroflexia bacterium TaxID=1672391 RepID=A0A6J4J7N3_9CHLR|nr:MAG: hypothetical protein AVDCRST_MAG93-2555 [uncultured Chloroflexia bacterium]
MEPGDMEPGDRLKTVAIGAMSAAKTAGQQAGEQPTSTIVDMQTVDTIVASWPTMSQAGVKEIVGKYGPPNEATDSRLIWFNNGPWKRTICYRDEVPHHFPNPHSDVVESFIDYRVPPENSASWHTSTAALSWSAPKAKCRRAVTWRLLISSPST